MRALFMRQPLWIRIGDYIVDHHRQPAMVNRKKYIMLALTCGWLCGAHRWYTGDKVAAILYLLTFWTGIAADMTIVDLLLLFLQHEPDENGMVLI